MTSSARGENENAYVFPARFSLRRQFRSFDVVWGRSIRVYTPGVGSALSKFDLSSQVLRQRRGLVVFAASARDVRLATPIGSSTGGTTRTRQWATNRIKIRKRRRCPRTRLFVREKAVEMKKNGANHALIHRLRTRRRTRRLLLDSLFDERELFVVQFVQKKKNALENVALSRLPHRIETRSPKPTGIVPQTITFVPFCSVSLPSNSSIDFPCTTARFKKN